MAYVYWHLEFAGASNIDQPTYIEIEVRGDKNESTNLRYSTSVALSRTQLLDPKTTFLYEERYGSDWKLPACYKQTDAPSEMQVARELYDFLSKVYSKYSVASVYWVGDFLYDRHVHQLKTFLAKHGINPYVGQASTYYIDTACVEDHKEITSPMKRARKIVDSIIEGQSNTKLFHTTMTGSWFVAQCNSRKPFTGRVSYFPIASDRGLEETMNSSVFIPVAQNTSGVVLFDANLYAQHKMIRDEEIEPMRYFFWVNLRAVAVTKEQNFDPAHVKVVLDTVKKNKDLYDIMRVNRGPESFFDYWSKQNNGKDPEHNLYGTFPPRKLEELSTLFNAIYYGEEEPLIEARNQSFSLIYLRHLLRNYKWSTGDMATAEDIEDDEVREFFLQHIKFRYMEDHEPCMPYGRKGTAIMHQGESDDTKSSKIAAHHYLSSEIFSLISSAKDRGEQIHTGV